LGTPSTTRVSFFWPVGMPSLLSIINFVSFFFSAPEYVPPDHLTNGTCISYSFILFL
jgi:hypothetical protein